MSSAQSIFAGAVVAYDYRVERPLARGGMGTLYVVTQLSTGAERVLKVMHARLVSDPRNRDRFLQEARVSARIESDHVVQVLAAGIFDDNVPWMIMELLRGEDLSAALERSGAFSPSLTMEVFRQLGHALGAAHAAGLVHRDLKPENVFLAHPRREGVPFTVKLLDFGIAKVLEDSSLPTYKKTTSAVGTPMWMAPEQAERGHISPAADVWSMGLLAYYLLTAKVYWHSGNQPDVTLERVLRELFVDPLESASARASRYGKSVPPGFDAWFARCVTRELGARFATANEAVAALPQALHVTPLSSTSQSLPPPPAAPPPATVAWMPSMQHTTPSGIPQSTGPSSLPPARSPSMAPPVSLAPPMSLTPPPPPAPIPQPYAPTGSTEGLRATPAPPVYDGRVSIQGGYTPVGPTKGGGGRLGWVAAGLVLLASGLGLAAYAVWIDRDDHPRTTTDAGRPVVAVADAGAPRGPVTRSASTMTAGASHTCAKVFDGTVRCWGQNLFGQLGDGTLVSRATPGPVVGLTGVAEVVAGRSHTCARTDSGAVACWGLNSTGQLGDGTFASRGTTLPVPGESDVRQIALGDGHTCALHGDATVRCWGANTSGQLGDGTSSHRAQPDAVTGLPPVVEVAAGDDHTCARTVTATVYCWGGNAFGQLGDGTMVSRSRPGLVPGLANVVALSIGAFRTCARTGEGRVLCWGRNDAAQLGDGTTAQRVTPTVIASLGATTSDLALGAFHTCARRTDGEVLCWGSGLNGRLGDGATGSRAAPTAVQGLHGVAWVSSYESHTCARTAEGTVLCWGANDDGQIGDGTTREHLRPSPVALR